MLLNKPSHEMRQDLSTAAKKLRCASVGMIGIAIRLSEVGLDDEALKLLATASDLNEIEDTTRAYVKEVDQGLVVRASLN